MPRDGAAVEVKHFRVAPENVTLLWPIVSPMLAKAFRTTTTHDIEDVRKSLMVQSSHLWIQESDAVDGCLVTEFAAYPKGLWARIWLAGARPGAKLEWDRFKPMIIAWAAAHHCKGIECVGRLGWLRLFPECAFEGAILRVPIP
jgi:hypothetical protein